jgi:hypothetical protein
MEIDNETLAKLELYKKVRSLNINYYNEEYESLLKKQREEEVLNKDFKEWLNSLPKEEQNKFNKAFNNIQ